MKSITFQMPNEDAKKIEEIAKKNSRSVGGQIRHYLNVCISKEIKK
ncbi:hypothetical protein KAR91_35855 [Candidatus Pacearchaeota archaeon]|nr:hypothetical protein [Candidatus Pacearchaeota archaeon]